MSAPLRRRPSTTTTTCARPLMMRLRAGKRAGSTPTPTGCSVTSAPLATTACAELGAAAGVVDAEPGPEHADRAPARVQRGAVRRLVDPAGHPRDHGDAVAREMARNPPGGQQPVEAGPARPHDRDRRPVRQLPAHEQPQRHPVLGPQLRQRCRIPRPPSTTTRAPSAATAASAARTRSGPANDPSSRTRVSTAATAAAGRPTPRRTAQPAASCANRGPSPLTANRTARTSPHGAPARRAVSRRVPRRHRAHLGVRRPRGRARAGGGGRGPRWRGRGRSARRRRGRRSCGRRAGRGRSRGR